MEIASSVSQPQPTRRALNEADCRSILQSAQAAACRSAGKAQLFGRFRHAAQLGYLDEKLDLGPPIHGLLLPVWGEVFSKITPVSAPGGRVKSASHQERELRRRQCAISMKTLSRRRSSNRWRAAPMTDYVR